MAEVRVSREGESSLFSKDTAPNWSVQISWAHNLLANAESKEKMAMNVHNKKKFIHEISFTLSKHNREKNLGLWTNLFLLKSGLSYKHYTVCL